ncbi:hypothetical protein [Frankia sp. Cr1]|uniref:hypothetical protein n=1 Tax=Frankia sp. Cr1 TaxID=3073931 RepID=UPI002AD2F96B|nr:hypothetical protein [Frankia sp. Cr1]
MGLSPPAAESFADPYASAVGATVLQADEVAVRVTVGPMLVRRFTTDRLATDR